ncbi:MAG: hypothetical protein AMJ43_10580 [Coxiella sp. DG_40]|jgi:7,8-dihydropterin-6-yl-methyl-4-(beta-D-ribofuranosyl)aminobenzene 5'-phosphate synthase|nr:MAG: hypothetical protein AMJ43_10580 [Coxiella sp. DG_40]
MVKNKRCKNEDYDYLRFGNIARVVGGMHRFSEFELFKDMELICPAHCTAHKIQIKTHFPGKCIGSGKVIEI